MSEITVKIKLFAAYQEAYNREEITFKLAEKTPVKAVLDKILSEKPELEKWRSLTRFGVNLVFVNPNTELNNGDEVVLIPPVSGG